MVSLLSTLLPTGPVAFPTPAGRPGAEPGIAVDFGALLVVAPGDAAAMPEQPTLISRQPLAAPGIDLPPGAASAEPPLAALPVAAPPVAAMAVSTRALPVAQLSPVTAAPAAMIAPPISPPLAEDDVAPLPAPSASPREGRPAPPPVFAPVLPRPPSPRAPVRGAERRTSPEHEAPFRVTEQDDLAEQDVAAATSPPAWPPQETDAPAVPAILAARTDAQPDVTAPPAPASEPRLDLVTISAGTTMAPGGVAEPPALPGRPDLAVPDRRPPSAGSLPDRTPPPPAIAPARAPSRAAASPSSSPPPAPLDVSDTPATMTQMPVAGPRRFDRVVPGDAGDERPAPSSSAPTRQVSGEPATAAPAARPSGFPPMAVSARSQRVDDGAAGHGRDDEAMHPARDDRRVSRRAGPPPARIPTAAVAITPPARNTPPAIPLSQGAGTIPAPLAVGQRPLEVPIAIAAPEGAPPALPSTVAATPMPTAAPLPAMPAPIAAAPTDAGLVSVGTAPPVAAAPIVAIAPAVVDAPSAPVTARGSAFPTDPILPSASADAQATGIDGVPARKLTRTEPAFRAFASALFDAARDPSVTAPAQVTPTAPADPRPLDLTQPRWPHAMVDRIERLRDEANAGDTRIRLIPDALGTIDVALRREGEAVHVAFHAERAETRQLLAEARPELTAIAEARGIKLADPAPSSSGGGWSGTQSNPGEGFAGNDREPGRQPQPSHPAAPARAAIAAEEQGDDTRIA